MQAARVWTTLVCRPCRRPLRLSREYETIRRHVSHVPDTTRDGQTLDADIRAQILSLSETRHSIKGSTEIRGRPKRILSKINDDEAIVSDSLAETLQAHRDQNASGPTIRRVNRASGLPLKPSPKDITRRGASVDLELTRNMDQDNERAYEDYVGKARALNMDWEILGEVPRSLRLPWMSRLDAAGRSSESAADRLSAEILVAGRFLTPKKEEAEVVSEAHNEIQQHVRKLFPHLRLAIVGSRASGLAMPLSDIDLNIEHYNPRILSMVFKALKFRGDHITPSAASPSAVTSDRDQVIQTSYAAFRARVPIIAGIHIKTGLEVQIQHSDGVYGSLETVKGLLAEHPNLQPLFKILRQMIKLRGLAVGIGRITSYPLLIMIAVVLKRNPHEGTPRHLGLNLIKFLDFWTEDIDLYSTGITHLPSPYVKGAYGPFDTTEEYFANEETALDTISRVVHDPVGAKPALFNVQRDLHKIHKGRNDYRMVLHDPANPSNDLGSGAFVIKHLQATLIQIKQKLTQDMTEWDRVVRLEGHMQNPSLSLLRSLLEGDYTLYNLERKRLLASR